MFESTTSRRVEWIHAPGRFAGQQPRRQADARPAADAGQHCHVLPAALLVGGDVPDDAGRGLELVEFLARLGIDRLIEVTGGRFWKPYGSRTSDGHSDLYEYPTPIDLTNPRLRRQRAAESLGRVIFGCG
jgi:hypothetical protein